MQKRDLPSGQRLEVAGKILQAWLPVRAWCEVHVEDADEVAMNVAKGHDIVSEAQDLSVKDVVRTRCTLRLRLPVVSVLAHRFRCLAEGWL